MAHLATNLAKLQYLNQYSLVDITFSISLCGKRQYMQTLNLPKPHAHVETPRHLNSTIYGSLKQLSHVYLHFYENDDRYANKPETRLKQFRSLVSVVCHEFESDK
jgi:hypothetical protein